MNSFLTYLTVIGNWLRSSYLSRGDLLLGSANFLIPKFLEIILVLWNHLLGIGCAFFHITTQHPTISTFLNNLDVWEIGDNKLWIGRYQIENEILFVCYISIFCSSYKKSKKLFQIIWKFTFLKYLCGKVHALEAICLKSDIEPHKWDVTGSCSMLRRGLYLNSSANQNQSVKLQIKHNYSVSRNFKIALKIKLLCVT